MIEDFIYKTILALALGAVLGFERQYTKKQELLGLRTFSLVSLLGAISTYLSETFFGNFWFTFILLAFVLIVSIYYFKKHKGAKIGWTTGTAFILSFAIGVMVGLGLFYEATFLTLIIAIILFSREKLHTFIAHLTKKEVSDSLAFMILLGVIYPLFPENIFIKGIEIPIHSIWYLVVLISAINFVVFLASRHLKFKHKLQVLSFLSGFVASTALCFSLSKLYKKNKHALNQVITGFNFSVLSMFVRSFGIVLLVLPFAVELWFPLISIILIVIISSFFFPIRKKEKVKTHVSSPFNVVEAVKFGVAILVLYILLDLFQQFVPELFYVTAFFAGFASTLSFAISLASLVLAGEIIAKEASLAILIATIGGLCSNMFIFIYHKQFEFFKKNAIPLILMVLVPLILIFIS